MKNICVVTGSRAEYGLIKNLIKKIDMSKRLNLQLVVTGSHLSKKFGNTINEIISDEFEISYKVDMKLTNDSPVKILHSIGIGLTKFGKVFDKLKPDLVLLIGDRYELFASAIPSIINRIPIAHIHGGELTEGAIDEYIRHSITKLSSLHFVATKEAKQRVIQLGENPKFIKLVGGLGVDNIYNFTKISKKVIEKKLNFSFGKKSLLVTYHPTTMELMNPEDEIKILIDVINQNPEINYIITSSNADVGGQRISKKMSNLAKKNNNICYVESLGQKLYFSCLSYVDGVIGNSSSGLLEVPSFKIGTINIGNRQNGRSKATSVIDTKLNKKSIQNSINVLFSEDFKKKIN